MSFRNVIGHRRLVALLARSIHRASLAPSLIFAGPVGIGKRLTAVAVAQALNCLTPRGRVRLQADQGRVPAFAWPRAIGQASAARRSPSGGGKPATATGVETDLEIDACGECAACTRIARGVHADVLIVEPGDSGSIKIDQIREVVDRVAYRPFEGKRRVVIVDEADALVTAAQNALLKTLEEPPPSSVLILVTSRPDVLLPTVRSRCPQLRFKPLAASEIAQALVARGRSEAEARAVAATADGSVRRALDASAGELVEARDAAERVLAHAASTSDPRRRLEGTTHLLVKGGAGGATDRDQLASHLRAMGSLLRDVELLAADADVGALANPDVRPSLERLTQTYKGERGTRAFAAVDRALVALERNAGVKIVADWVVLQL